MPKKVGFKIGCWRQDRTLAKSDLLGRVEELERLEELALAEDSGDANFYMGEEDRWSAGGFGDWVHKQRFHDPQAYERRKEAEKS